MFDPFFNLRHFIYRRTNFSLSAFGAYLWQDKRRNKVKNAALVIYKLARSGVVRAAVVVVRHPRSYDMVEHRFARLDRFCCDLSGGTASKEWAEHSTRRDYAVEPQLPLYLVPVVSAVVGDRERQRRLVIVGRVQVMDAAMARRTDRQEIRRKLVEDPDVSQVVDFGRGVLEATLADVVGAFERAATFLGPKFRAEIPLVGSDAV
jgi:hypothetical protein